MDPNPLLLDVPDTLTTARLLLRVPRAGDGVAVNRAVAESFSELNEWMPWAKTLPSVAESEQFVRDAHVKFLRRDELPLLMLNADDGELIGASGMHHIDWTVRRFEIGYWCRTTRVGRGYVTEAVAALTRFLFTELGARRVEVRMDERNVRSIRVPERLGFLYEGTLRHDALDTSGQPRNTRIYGLISLAQLVE